jgi:uncharacterized protein (DUF342 family)
MGVKKLSLKGKSVQACLNAGLEEIGLPLERTMVEIVQRENDSFFGYRDAVVSITYDTKESEKALFQKNLDLFKGTFKFRFHEGKAQVHVPPTFYDLKFIESDETRKEYLKNYLISQGVPNPSEDILEDISKDTQHQFDYTTVWELPVDKINETQAEIMIKISEDEMKADAIIFPGTEVTSEEVYEVLRKNGIIKGIIAKNIQGAISKRVSQFFTIAIGKPPINDQPGIIETFFREDEHSEFDKLMEQLTIDTRTVKEINIAERNQLLLRLGDLIEGEDGYTIKGKVLQKALIKDDNKKLVLGQNVYYSDNEKEVYAKSSGHIVWKPETGLIDVEPIYIVEGNVDFNEGNIIGFVGKVIIKGDVKEKFTVSAEGDIEIHGCVEDGTVKSLQGKVMVAGTIINQKGGVVEAKESIRCNIAQNANMKADKIYVEKECLNSRLQAESEIHITGAPGAVIGGEIRANNLVRANIIGSPSWVATKIYVGDVSEMKTHLKGSRQKKEKIKNKLQEAEQVVKILQGKKSDGTLTKGQEKQLGKTLQEIPALKDEFNYLEQEENELKTIIQSRKSARLEIVNIMHPQVDVSVFEGKMIPNTAEQFTGFLCKDGRLARYSL